MSDPKANPTNLRKYARGDFSIRGGLMRMAAADLERLRERIEELEYKIKVTEGERDIAVDHYMCAMDRIMGMNK